MIRRIKLFMVDDHPMVIEGMSSMIAKEPTIELLGHATSAASCLGFLLENTPDVILLDVNLPDQNGIDLCAEIKKRKPEINILAISSFSQGSYVKQMMENGALGYILKNVSREEFIKAVTKVAAGYQYLGYEASQAMLQEKKRAESLPVLTKREKEVLHMLAKGFSSNQIAQHLQLSSSTIEANRMSMMTKFEVTNTVALLAVCTKNSLIKL